MPEPAELSPDIMPGLASARPARGGSPQGITLAWIVIAALITVMIMRNQPGPGDDPRETEAAEQILHVMMELQGRYLYGGASQFESLQADEALLGSARDLFGGGSLGQRMRLAVLVAAFEGPGAGRDELAGLRLDIEEETLNRRGTDRPFELSAADEALMRDLDIIFRAAGSASADASPDAAAASANVAQDAQADAARQRVRADMGWFGQLAASLGDDGDVDAGVTARSQAVRTFIVAIVMVVSGIGLSVVGTVLLIIMLLFVLARRVPPRCAPPGAAPHGIYAQTFALWLVLFVLCTGPVVALLVRAGLPDLTATTIAFFLSLAALVWPALRGIPLHQMRADIGLTRGRSLPVEVGAGIAGYVMGLPFLIAGAVITFTLMFFSTQLAAPPDETVVRTLFPTDTGPAHPIVGRMANANIFTVLQILLVASVAAPIVEEIMFRGVLYRHLRDASGGSLRSISIPLSAVFSAFIFAAVHPQGWMGVPVLMGLAIAFALAREWRGSLIAPIVMHAISNGLVMTMLTLMVAR